MDTQQLTLASERERKYLLSDEARRTAGSVGAALAGAPGNARLAVRSGRAGRTRGALDATTARLACQPIPTVHTIAARLARASGRAIFACGTVLTRGPRRTTGACADLACNSEQSILWSKRWTWTTKAREGNYEECGVRNAGA